MDYVSDGGLECVLGLDGEVGGGGSGVSGRLLLILVRYCNR